MNSKTIAACTVFALLAGAGLAHAGPITPPAGPVTSTYKTMVEVEPRIAISLVNTPGDADSIYKITQAGSYYLTGNIAGVSGKSGIEIAADNVSIDLNGFVVTGSFGTLAGIDSPGTQSDIHITNGKVQGWTQGGIRLAISGQNHTVDHVMVYSNSALGLRCGANAIVRDCSLQNNTGGGISLTESGLIRDCVLANNPGTGIVLANASTVTDSIVRGNVVGINAAAGSTIRNCTVRSNTSTGVLAGNACIISGCNVSLSGSDGINAGDQSIISDCVLQGNGADGIKVTNYTTITGNTCDGHIGNGTPAGIHATGSHNRIEGNTVEADARGILVDGFGNAIFKNTASGCSINFVFAANNRFGAILDLTIGSTSAVSGNTAAATMGTTDPFANFAH